MTLMIKFIELPNGVRLPYIEQGDPTGVHLLLLHGFTGSSREFETIFAHLPKSVHTIALTQRGHGDASHPNSGYRLQDFSADLLEFMKAKGLHKAVIVGHSMGSAVAQRFAIDNPDRTLGLVLVGASITRTGDPKVQDFLDSTISSLIDPIDPDFVRQFSASMWVKPIPEELLEIVVQEALKVPARVWIQAFEGRPKEKISEEIERWLAATKPGDGKFVLTRGPEVTPGEPDGDTVALFRYKWERLTQLLADISGGKEHLLSALDDALKSAALQENEEALLLSAFMIYYLKQNGYKIEPYVKRLKEAEALRRERVRGA